MRNMDFGPLYRTIVGFDRVANQIETARQEHASNWPPYNVIQTNEDEYKVEIAVAGFSKNDLEVEIKEGLLTIKGEKTPQNETVNYLHRGIAERSFERKFQLADHVKVVNANLNDGLLTVSLVREIPEAYKPRKVEINTNQTDINDTKLDTVKNDLEAA